MKKILALILVVGCMLALVSCFPTNTPEEPDDSDAIPTIQAKIDASAPNGAEVTVTLKSTLGDLNGSYDVTYNADGTATVAYTYEKFNTISAENSELKSTISGTATVAADGTVSGDLGTEGVNAVSFELKLDESKLNSVAINAGVLTANVKAADTAAVLGVALNYDVMLTVVTGTAGVTSMSVSYTTNVGAVEVVTLYK